MTDESEVAASDVARPPGAAPGGHQDGGAGGAGGAAAAALVAVLAVVYFPVLFGQVLFFRDPANWTYPARLFVRRTLLSGALPTWNPLGGLGFPTLANPLYGIFYPPNWLFLTVPERLVVHMVTWQSLLHLAFGGLGAICLADRFLPPMPRARRVSALFVAGIAFSLSGYITAQWTAGLLLLADAWVPWCGLGFVVLVRGAGAPGIRAFARGVAAAAAPVAGALLLGEVFIAFMGLGFGMATAAVDLWARRASPAHRPVRDDGRPPPWRRLAGAVALAMTLAGLAGAVVVLPAAQAAASTDRGRPLDRAMAEIASLHPIRLVELIAPGAMGVPYEDYPGGRWLNEETLDGTPLSHSMYLGAAVIALAAAALGRGRRLAQALTILLGFFLVVALGKHTPVHQLLRLVVRPLGYMRYPEKYMVLVTTWLALLAGLGTARVLSGEVRLRRLLAVAALLVALAALAGLYPDALVPFVRRGAIVGAGAVAAVAVVAWLGARRPRLAAGLCAAVVAADLASAAVPLQHFGPASVATTAAPVVTSILADSAPALAPPRAHRARPAEISVARHLAVDSHAAGQARAMQVLVENASSAFGIGLLPGYDAAIPTAASALWAEGMRHGFRVLRLFGVGYVVLAAPDGDEPSGRRVALEPIDDPAPGARLYRVRDPLPRIYLPERVEVADGTELSRRLFEEPVLSGRLALVPPGSALPPAGEGPAGVCQLTAFAATALEAHCRTTRASLAVIVEQQATGWEARLDDQPAPLLRANGLFRALRLEPGDHRIRLTFHPPGLLVGLTSTVLAVLAIVALAVLGRSRSRR